MSNENAGSHNATTVVAQEPALTPESVVEQLRALRAQIPNYLQLPIPEAQKLQIVHLPRRPVLPRAVRLAGYSKSLREGACER